VLFGHDCPGLRRFNVHDWNAATTNWYAAVLYLIMSDPEQLWTLASVFSGA